MAYEVVYYYHHRIDDGGYDTCEVKEMTKRYGKGYDELPLEKLAANIITQLSRRDVWVVDVKVFEYVKKEIKFKETKGGGIVLGNRKFTLNDGQGLLEEQHEIPTPSVLTGVPTAPVRPLMPNKPIKQVVFDPPQELMNFARHLNLTVGRQYPVFEEKIADMSNPQSGINYFVQDNAGRSIGVRAFYFQDVQAQLLFENESVPMVSLEKMPVRQTFVDSVKSYASGADAIYDMPDLR